MKLISCQPFHTGALPGIGARSGMVIKPGEGAFADWSLSVRGPSVFLVSPAGWRPGQVPEGAERTVFEIPRSHCHLQWSFAEGDTFDGVTKWDAPVAKPPAPPQAKR